MISYNPKSWFGIIFKFHKSDTFQKMFWVLLIFAFFSWLVVFFELKLAEAYRFKSTTAIHSLLGFVMALLLVFRTNSAYDRWWEGRKQWGALVNDSRTLAMKVRAIIPDPEYRNYFKAMIPDFVFAMKEHLRQGVDWDEIEGHELADQLRINRASHIPNAIAADNNEKTHELHRKGIINGDQLITMDKELRSFTGILGACERIRNTPIPFSYSLFLKKFIFAYTLTMPLGLVFDFKYWTVPIVTFVLYVFGSLELIAEEIEDPFGRDANDLPLDDISKRIRANVNEILS